jgi:hypothetical protein
VDVKKLINEIAILLMTTISLHSCNKITLIFITFYRILGGVDEQFDTELFGSPYTTTSIFIGRRVLETVERGTKGIESIKSN